LFAFALSNVVVQQDQNLYLLGNTIKSALKDREFDESVAFVRKTLEDVDSIDELHRWMNGVLIPVILMDGTLDGVVSEPGNLYGKNFIVGGIRIAQLRMKRTPCSAHMPAFGFSAGSSDLLQCYGDAGGWSQDTEDQEPFGLGPIPFQWDGWNDTYLSVEEERGFGFNNFRSENARWYVPPAYSIILSARNPETSAQMIRNLRPWRYIDAATLLFIVDVNVYNPQMDVFSVIRVAAELPKAGGVLPSIDLMTSRLYSYFEGTETVWQAAELVVVALIALFLVEEASKGVHYGIRYFTRLDTIIHNLNLLIYVCVWLLRAVAVANAPKAEDVVMDSDTFYDLRPAMGAKALSSYLNAFNAFLCFVKLVKYLSWSPRYALVTSTLAKAFAGVSRFALIFLLFMYGFASAHMLAFGTKVKEFRNMTFSSLQLLKSLLGDFDLDELHRANYIMGPMMFALYVAVSVFVVLNVVIALVVDGYAEAKAELGRKSQVHLLHEMVRYVKETVHWALTVVTCRRRPLAERRIAMARRLMEGHGATRWGCCRQHVYQLSQESLAGDQAAAVVATTLHVQRMSRGAGPGDPSSALRPSPVDVAVPRSTRKTSVFRRITSRRSGKLK
jgi:hypothetical protein